MLDYMIKDMFSFARNCQTVFKMAVTFTFLLADDRGFLLPHIFFTFMLYQVFGILFILIDR